MIETNGSIFDYLTNQPSSDSDRYLEQERLGIGGMGEIYRGLDLQCHRPVAIKKIRKEFQNDPEVRAKFHAEAELTASLEHPGIIPIYGHGIDAQGRDYYVMRLISGEGSGNFAQSIREFHEQAFSTRNEQTWYLRDLVRRLIDIADTIAYAHSQNIVHRDLKPSNILIGSYGETLIADWGLARRIHQPASSIDQDSVTTHAEDFSDTYSSSLSTSGSGFRAPDFKRGKSDSAMRSADIYSLGAMLLCVLTNHPPSPHSTYALELTNAPGIKSLMAVADKATADNWQDRYSSAEEFRSELLRWIAGEPVNASPEGWLEQATRWPSRHRTAASGLATAFVITLLGGVSFLAYQAKQNHIAKAQAQSLQIALDDSASLLKETQQANKIAEQRRLEAVSNRQLAEKRENLAFEGLLQFPSMISENEQVFQSPQLASIKDLISERSKQTFEVILKDLQNDLPPNPASVAQIALLTHRLAKMESGLNQPDQANQLIDEACNWMRERLDESKKLGKLTESNEKTIRLKIGELRNLQGSLTVRHGRFKESRPRFEEAVQELEPLAQHGQLDRENQLVARLTLMRALSGISMHEANFGKLSEARKIQQRALSWIESKQATTVAEAIAILEVHGNTAILHERAGEIPEALRCLDVAAKATENVLFPSAVEIVSLQSQFGQYRARLMMATSDKESAVNILSELVKKEAASVEQHPNLSGLVEVYQLTAIELQTILTSTGKHDQAIQLLADWTELAQKLTRLTAPPQSHWILLINAHHSAGHLYQEIKRNELALEKYATAIEVCQEALRRNYRTQQVLYQLVELNLHQFQILAPNTPLDQLEPHFEKAVSAAEELMRMPTIPQVNNLAAIDKLHQNLNLMRTLGHEDAAYRWGATLQFKKLSR